MKWVADPGAGPRKSPVPELASVTAESEKQFDTISYAPLSRYFEEQGLREAFATYSGHVLHEILNVLAKERELLVSAKPTDKPTVLFFGHAEYNQAVGLALANSLGLFSQVNANVESLTLGEVECLQFEKSGFYYRRP